tara:strand:- start:1377 stop:2324 length:948 start_codon:yes stop_codon:yes gene_type:complete
MNIYQVLVLLIILLVILIVIYNQITNKENYVTNQHRIKYHVVPDFVPEINGKKYIKYLTNNQLLHGFTRGISTGFKADATLVVESINKNIGVYFKNQQEKYNIFAGIKNEVNSTALILNDISSSDVLENSETADLVKFLLMNTVDNYSIERDSKDVIHIVVLPFVLKDSNLVLIDYYGKKVLFMGLFKTDDFSKFLNTYPMYRKNETQEQQIKDLLENNNGIQLRIDNHNDRFLNGLKVKCNYLSKKCTAGSDCENFNKIMEENISNMINQKDAYKNYLENLDSNVINIGDGRPDFCEDLADKPPSNFNAPFSFL